MLRGRDQTFILLRNNIGTMNHKMLLKYIANKMFNHRCHNLKLWIRLNLLKIITLDTPNLPHTRMWDNFPKIVFRKLHHLFKLQNGQILWGKRWLTLKGNKYVSINGSLWPKDALCFVKDGWIETTTKIGGTREGTITRAIEKNSWKNNSIVKLTWCIRIILK